LKNLPRKLEYLRCEDNQLVELYSIPNTLTHLYCNNNKLLFFKLHQILKLNRFVKLFNTIKVTNLIFYHLVRKRCSKYKEKLIAYVFHPSRIFKHLCDDDDIETYISNM
jgi:hypothetical protein